MVMRPIWTLCCAALLWASCSCPELEPDPIAEERVREATITQFDPRWDATQNAPVPTYSIHTFLFPSTPGSSGSLPNDDRVGFGQLLILDEATFNVGGALYRAQVFTNRPPNSVMQGDWMLVEVDVGANPPTAWIRVAGRLGGPLPQPLLSASAEALLAYVRQNLGEIRQAAQAATPYGRGLPTVRTVNDALLRVLDASGADVTGSVAVPPELLQRFAAVLAPAVDVQVRLGEVYYYQARSGAEFVVLIEDIRPGTLPPNLNRMTIKFVQVVTPEGCRSR
jgi:hypothetical protein